MTRTLAQLDLALAAIENELGPVVDPNAQTIRKRILELGQAEDGLVDRVRDVPGGTTILQAVLAAIPPQPPADSTPVDATAVLAVLAAFRIHIAKDPETDREYIGIGMEPNFDDWSPIQIGGGLAGQISGYNSDGTANSIVILDGDGGMRFRQYGLFGKKGFIRNTLSRPFTVLAMDSLGEVCSSQVPVGETADGGQNWYIRTDWVRKAVRFVAFKVGWKAEVAESSVYGAGDIIK